MKNVLAVGAGLSDGLGFGANTRIALITRGLIGDDAARRRARRAGAKRSWVSPASATWCSPAPTTSRATGASAWRWPPARACDEALAEIGQVVEGYTAARAVHAVARREKVDMPIVDGIYRVLYENEPAKDVVQGPHDAADPRRSRMS